MTLPGLKLHLGDVGQRNPFGLNRMNRMKALIDWRYDSEKKITGRCLGEGGFRNQTNQKILVSRIRLADSKADSLMIL